LKPNPKLVMIAALEREIRPLVKGWNAVEREHEGRRFRFYEGGDRVLVCAGIGFQPARRAAEAAIALYQPARIQSVGFAGALLPNVKVGEVFIPAIVINGKDNSRSETGVGEGKLLSFDSVVGVVQKSKLAEAYGAQAVDMEAAAVALAAHAHQMEFSAVKAISDEVGFEMPPMDHFISPEGGFQTGRFIAFSAIRPWLWTSLAHLAANTSRATRSLCAYLKDQQEGKARDFSESKASFASSK